MQKKGQQASTDDHFSFLSFFRGRGTGSAREVGVAFLARISLILIVLSLLPLQQYHSLQPAAVSAAASSSVYLPFIMRRTGVTLTGPGTWPMAAGNPERTSWTPTEVRGALKAEWYTHFDSYISQKVQIIAADNKLFVSASNGLHALDSNSGEELWFFPTSLPPGNSPTYDNGSLYLGSFNRKMYAMNASNGGEIWSYTAGAGFETNPLVIGGLVLAGNRDGYFYAIHASGSQAGRLAWRFKTDGAILYSAAYKDGVVYFASEDMRAYALNVNDGSLIWKTDRLPGAGFHSWWPVIYGNYVVFSAAWPYRSVQPFANASAKTLDREAYPDGTAEGTTIGSTGREAGDWASGTTTMNASRISQYFEAKPQRRTTIVLSRANGQEFSYDSDNDRRPEYAPFLYVGTNSGNRYPPVVGPDGVLYQANDYIYGSAIPRGHITGWKFGTSTISIPTTDTNAVDEPMAYAVGGSTMYWKRCCDRRAGSFSLTSDDRSTYFDEGGIRLRRTLPELFNAGWEFAYWKHGDTSPPIPYNGRVYTINNNAVVALSPNGRDPVLPLDESTGQATGTDPDSIERSTIVTGLNTKVTLDNGTWPLLYQQERYYELREETTTRANHFKLFEVAGAGSGNPSSASISNNSVASSIVSNFSGGTLTTWVSKRAPAVLFQNTGSQYQLRGSLAGMAYMTSAGVQVRTGSATVTGSSLTESWLLVWDSTSLHRWMPMVISLQNRPTQVSFTATGITLTYSGAAGSLAVTPLYGMSAPKSAEETAWRTSIPTATVDRVKAMNHLARAFPSGGTEARAINASGDVELIYTYQYIITTDAWNTGHVQLAYLPTHLALAAWNGSPIRINGQPFQNITDAGFVTPIGRVAGAPNINSARVTLPGAANTWRNTPGNPGQPASGDALQAQLIAEVQKILAAGHLLPGYGNHGLWDTKATGRLGPNLADYWHNPAETIYTLIRALPLLPADLQTQVRSYISSEFSAYPTYSITNTGWASGASREAFAFPPEVEAERAAERPCGDCSVWDFTPENHYASWMYASNFGSASTIYNNTVSKIATAPVYQQSLSYALNSQIAGYIGYLRLAALANAGAKMDAENQLVNMLVLRAALSKYPSALQATGFEYGGYKWAMRTYAPNMPDTLFVVRTIGTLWSQLPLYGFTMDRIYGLSGPGTGGAYVFGIDYVNLVPELGAFMRSYTLAEDRAAIADYEKRAPYWFVAEAEEGAGEGVVRPIYDTIALYQAKAFILGASRADLEQYLDVPANKVGDLYFIQKLILALSAGS